MPPELIRAWFDRQPEDRNVGSIGSEDADRDGVHRVESIVLEYRVAGLAAATALDVP